MFISVRIFSIYVNVHFAACLANKLASGCSAHELFVMSCLVVGAANIIARDVLTRSKIRFAVVIFIPLRFFYL